MSGSHAPRQPLRVLFVCPENAARSQIAEALLLRKRQRLAAINRATASDETPG